MKLKPFAIGVAALVVAATLGIVLAERATAPAGVKSSSPAPSRSSQPSTGDGTISGTVTVGPTSPVCRSGEPCTGPGANLIVRITQPGGQPVSSAKTDSKGHYSMSVPAGTYTVAVTNAVNSKSASVTVAAGQVATQDFSLDTGLR